MIQPLELMLWMDSEVHSSSPGPEELTATLGLCGVPLLQGLQAASASRVLQGLHHRTLSSSQSVLPKLKSKQVTWGPCLKYKF